MSRNFRKYRRSVLFNLKVSVLKKFTVCVMLIRTIIRYCFEEEGYKL